MIVATLVGQGLTLPWLIRRLGVRRRVTRLETEETHARLVAVEAALRPARGARAEYPTHLPLIDQIQGSLEHEVSHVVTPARTSRSTSASRSNSTTGRSAVAVLLAQREAVIQLRDDGSSTTRRCDGSSSSSTWRPSGTGPEPGPRSSVAVTPGARPVPCYPSRP